MEEEKKDDNGKEIPKFNYFVKIFFNSETKDYSFETNVPDYIIGYGMVEFAKKGIDNHIAKLAQRTVIPAKGGMMNFARRFMK